MRLRLLLLFRFATTIASTTNDDSCPSTPVVVSPGTLLNEEARFPLQVVGDWEAVLESPDIAVVATDVVWPEGPLVRKHHGEEEFLYASDTVRALIYRLFPDKNNHYKLQVWATHAGGIDPAEHPNRAEPGSNGMATDGMDPNYVLINQHGLHRVVRCRLDQHPPGAPLSECPGLEVLADSYQGKAFNSPNDVVVHPNDGSVWFTDPNYGLLEPHRFCDEFSCSTGKSYLDEKSELGFQGVYKVDRSNNNNNNVVELVSRYHRRPNGLALDGNRLWVADSTIGSPSWTAYDSLETVGGRKASHVLTPATLGEVLGTTNDLPPLTGGEGLSDGVKMDEKGRIWASIPNGFAVIDPATAKVVCQILMGVNTSNLAFGGANGDVWLTGKGGIWKIQRKIG